MLKLSIDANVSYAIQNSACQIVEWKPKGADQTFQCCSVNYHILAGLESGTLLINVSKFNLSLSVCNLTQS